MTGERVSRGIFGPAALIVLLIVMCVASGAAQTTVLKPGATVRFRLGGDDPYHVARLSELTADSLMLAHCETCFGRLRYGRNEVSRLDVSRRAVSSSRIGIGALIGGLVGAAIGAAGAATCHGGPRCEQAGEAAPFLFLLGAALGAISAYLTSYTWDPVRANASTQR